jgi:hypothetical protein
VYVVWSDCRFEASCSVSDIVLSTSSNGTTWSPVKRIPIDPVGSGADHFITGLAVDQASSGASAHLGLTFYYYPNGISCTPSTCKLDVGFISSTNGGASWSAKEQLTGPMMVPWAPLTTQGYMVGDYISTSIPPGDHDLPSRQVQRSHLHNAGRCAATGGRHKHIHQCSCSHHAPSTRTFLFTH